MFKHETFKHEKKSNGAKINEENIMQIIENFTFGN